MKVERYTVGAFQVNTWLLVDEATGHAAIVDTVLETCPAPMPWIVRNMELSGVSACDQQGWVFGSGDLVAHRVELRDSAGLTVSGGDAALSNWTVIGAPVFGRSDIAFGAMALALLVVALVVVA